MVVGTNYGLALGRDRQHKGRIVCVGNGDQNLGYAELLGTPRRGPGQIDPGGSAAGDLDVFPAETTPAHSEALHDGLFPGEPGGETATRIGIAVGVLPFVIGEATPLEVLAVLMEEMADAVDLGEVDSEADDGHEARLGLRPNLACIKYQVSSSKYCSLGGSVDTDKLIQAQIAYYRARAREYDGEVSRAIEELPGYLERFVAEKAELEAWLFADPPTGHVLEIAAGSGNRTTQMLRSADRVTALDAAPEMLELLRAKHPTVETIEVNVFDWEPPRRYDNVFFGYWISHIPEARWGDFWELVDRALVPGGRVWFMDNAHPDYADTNGPGDWPVAAGLRVADRVDDEVQTRTLLDGSEWTMVKRFWWPDDLEAELADLGWEASVGHTSFAFIYGVAERL